jgi:hypothetical protein
MIMSQSHGIPDTRPQEIIGRTVVGLFGHRAHAEAAIRDLQAAGFPQDRIGVAVQQRVEQGDLLEGVGGDAAEGAAKGAVSGGVLGGLLGLLGSLLIPGVGPVVVGGVLASTLTGVGIGAATGGLLGVLVALGVPEEDARHFDGGLRSGGTLVTVDAGARTPEALAILQHHEVDFGPSGALRFDGVDWSARDNSAPAAAAPSAYAGEERRVFLDPTYSGPERRVVGV